MAIDFSNLEESEDNIQPKSTDVVEEEFIRKAARVGLNLLPAIGTTAGAIVGGIGGLVAGVGIGGLPGAIGGGAVGGAAGEAGKQLGKRFLGDEDIPQTSGEAAKSIGKEAVIGALEGTVGGAAAKIGSSVFKAGRILLAPSRRVAGQGIRATEVAAGARPASQLAEAIPKDVTRKVIGTGPKGATIKETSQQAEKRFLDDTGRFVEAGGLKETGKTSNNTLIKLFQQIDDIVSFTGERALTKAGKSKAFALKKSITDELNVRIPNRKKAAEVFKRAVAKEDIKESTIKILKQTIPFALAGAGSAIVLRRLIGGDQ